MELETKRVHTKGVNGEQIINASDFNPDIHTEVSEEEHQKMLAREARKQEAPKQVSRKKVQATKAHSRRGLRRAA